MKQSCQIRSSDAERPGSPHAIDRTALSAGLAQRDTGIDVPVCLTANGEILAPLPGI